MTQQLDRIEQDIREIRNLMKEHDDKTHDIDKAQAVTSSKLNTFLYTAVPAYAAIVAAIAWKVFL